MKVSVVCPYYNEAGIVEAAVETLLAALATLDHDWELVVVNDGSTDGSERLVERIAAREPRLRALGYAPNRGRGHALRTGIAAASGDVIVTTEIDLSWGEDIVQRLVAAMEEHPEADIVVASPHLPGGGYRNVPARRVRLSRLGNRVIRACMSGAATMNTGMTRAYKREVIQTLPLYEDKKEFHLEVILKANAFGLVIHEIPALLEWKEYKHRDATRRGQRVERRSSSRVNRLIVSHSLFSLFANPVRYVWAMSLGAMVLGAGAFVTAVVFKLVGIVAAYTALLSLLLFVVGILLFVLGVVLKQGNMVQREIWALQRAQLQAARAVHGAGAGRLPEAAESAKVGRPASRAG
jgi:dolichol-phosphate mannosyltransferase